MAKLLRRRCLMSLTFGDLDLVTHYRVLLDIHAQGVEEVHRIHRLERSGLLGGDRGYHGVGNRADELGRYVRCVALQQEAL